MSTRLPGKPLDQTLIGTLGIELTELTPERVSARMPVDARTHQPYGLLHGGASVALAETLASIGGGLNVDAERESVVGLEINANHLHSVREGYVTGVAQPLHRGRRTQVWSIEIRDAQGRLVCTSRCTLAVVERRPQTSGRAEKKAPKTTAPPRE